MVRKIIHVLVDDLDHSRDRVSTRRFSLDGVEYEIDLSADNNRRLNEALTPYLRAARRLPKIRRPRTAPQPGNTRRRT